MGTTLLYKLFRAGGVPRKRRPELEREGIILIEEGVSGSLSMKKYRAPKRYHGRRWSWVSASLVITGKRFVVFTSLPHFSPVIDVALDDARFSSLKFEARGDDRLRISLDPSVFHDDRSGHIVCSFSTPNARRFLDRLRSMRR